MRRTDSEGIQNPEFENPEDDLRTGKNLSRSKVFILGF